MGGHGEGGSKATGESRRVGPGWTCRGCAKEAVHCCWVGSSSTNSPGTAPSPWDCPGTPGAGTGRMYWAACSWAGQGWAGFKAGAGGLGAAKKNSRDPSVQGLSNPGCSSPTWYSKPTLAGRGAALPSLQAAGGAAGAAGRAELSGPAALSGKEMSKSRGPGREGEERDSWAPQGTSADPLPPPPAAACCRLPLPQFPQRGTAAPPGPGGGKVEVKHSHTAMRAPRCPARQGGGQNGQARQEPAACARPQAAGLRAPA